jgi:hypothetical protein
MSLHLNMLSAVWEGTDICVFNEANIYYVGVNQTRPRYWILFHIHLFRSFPSDSEQQCSGKLCEEEM